MAFNHHLGQSVIYEDIRDLLEIEFSQEHKTVSAGSWFIMYFLVTQAQGRVTGYQIQSLVTI